MEFVKVWIKAIAAFALTVLGNLATNFATQGTPVPQTGQQWLSLLITTVIVTAGVAAPRNKQTEGQVKVAITKDLSRAEQEEVANTALDALPKVVQDNITAYRAARP